MQAHMGKNQIWVRRQKEKQGESIGPSINWGKAMAGWGKHLGLASLNDSVGSGAQALASSWLVLGAQLI